ncbi:uncharacterized protein LOC106873178 [Octopus bimaculoides]|uniref:Uncharacterized protein n=1 Tax=Octopus bimaculoides TaxID=37653 RepID=A0A0L8ID17_OCTBM|nr:uncharacterized protein LOC106873178 [Octopus bimaculoides]|eukprot:XP_014775896.1 PREDICTED: uncharacterized protein LOC106873178 [Octopus bimaculoides]
MLQKDTMEQFLTAFILTLLFIHNSAECPKPKYIEPYYLYPTNCCQKDLDVFKPFPNGKYPEKPKILELTDFLRNGKRGIKAVWNASLTHLKGFKIEYEFKGSDKKICRILDFSEFLKNKSNSNHDFKFEIYPVTKNKEILVHLYPLPESGNNYPPAQEVDTFMCREWISKIDYSLKDDALIVEFKQGPSKCNIKVYNLTLYDGQLRILKEVAVSSSKTLSELKHKFYGLCPGIYEISVEIFDEFWNVDGKCICRAPNGRCGVQCFRSKSNRIEVVGSSCTMPSSTNMTTAKTGLATKPKSSFKLTIFLAIIGAMIGLLLLVLSFYCFKRTIQEKRGLLFYIEDHSYHCEAIDKFVSFMNKSKCKLEVAARLVKGGDPLRLSFEIQKSDFIILVYSKALHKRIQAWKSNQDYVNFLKEDNSALLTASLLKELKASNKLIICKFPQAPKSGISSEFPSVKCYTLTKELNLLIQQIHGTGVDQELTILVKSNKFNHKFNSLTNTIKDAANFEENSSYWFEDKYICPKKMESLMPDDTEKFLLDGYEHSIYSIPISYMFEQINANNDTIA